MDKGIDIDEVQLKAKSFDFLHFLYCGTHLEPVCKCPPHQVYIELTNACNYNCTHCPRSGQRRKVQHMDFEIFKKIVGDVASFQPFVDLYLQGEPLVYPKIVDAVKYAAERGLKPRITTNSSLLTREKSIALIEAGLNKIEFSTTGASREVYETIYQGKDFEVVLNNITTFLEENAKRGFPVHTRPTFVFEETSKKDKNRFLELFSKLPFDDVYISPLINMFGWNEEVNLENFKKRKKEDWPSCKAPWRQIGIQSNGDVRGCIFDYDSRYLIGNVKDNTVLEIWNSEKMQRFRENIINKDYDKIETENDLPLCADCSQIWGNEISEEISTTQRPADFAKEAEAFFANAANAFQAKFLDVSEKEEKYNYLKNNKEQWIKEVLND